MSDVMKVAITGIVAAICAIVVRKQVPELAVALAVCAAALILLFCSGALASMIEFMDELVEIGGLSKSVVAPVIKVTGIAVVTRLASDFCKDAKEGAIATVVETAGNVFALLTIIPLMAAVLELLRELV